MFGEFVWSKYYQDIGELGADILNTINNRYVVNVDAKVNKGGFESVRINVSGKYSGSATQTLKVN